MALSVHKRSLPLRRRGVGHKLHAKEHRYHLFGVVVISTIVLIILTALVGLGFAWYLGQVQPPPKIETPSAAELPKEQPKPVIPKNKPVGVAIQTVSSPVSHGDVASLSIHTSPLVTCSVVLEYNDKPVKVAGLEPQEADEFGIASWTWGIDESVPYGKWPMTITCKNKKYSGVAVAELQVKQSKE